MEGLEYRIVQVISNLIGVIIIIVPVVVGMPLFPVIPSDEIKFENLIYVFFNPTFPQKFHLLERKITFSVPIIKCRCGISDKVSKNIVIMLQDAAAWKQHTMQLSL